jgi:hypothetical protein
MSIDAGAVERLVDLALAALARDEPLSPAALTLLVRRYAATGREDLGDALGPALAGALNAVVGVHDGHVEGEARSVEAFSRTAAAEGGRDRPAVLACAPDWIRLFLEAATISTDDRLLAAAGSLVSHLCGERPHGGSTGRAMRAVDACLYAAQPVGRPDLVAPAIDELERIVGLTYRPGSGLARVISAGKPEAGSLSDYSAAASALLTAYSITGRIPYSMLAEELVQVARRQWWNAEQGAFADSTLGSLERFLWNSETARVLIRLAALAADRDYQQAAVTAAEADYAGDAARILVGLGPEKETFGLAGAVYGLAAIELAALA